MDDSPNTFSSVQLQVELSPAMNLQLNQVVEASLRSKVKEATLRLMDHLLRCPGVVEKKSYGKESTTSLIIFLTSEMNELLTASANKHNRNKALEAKVRLEDHLRRFSDIARVGVCLNG